MNTGQIISQNIQRNRLVIEKSVREFDESELRSMYIQILNKIDYKISDRESLPKLLEETMKVINSTKDISITDQTYLEFASVLIDASEHSGFDSVELLYSLINQ